MSLQYPDLERRLTELQSQINRLSLSLHLWNERQERLQPMETRLTQLTEQCTEIVDRWATTGERHAQAVDELEQRLSEWTSVESRAQQDASARMEDLQRIIEHEWSALKQLHEEPVNELRDQAATLTEVCVAAATTALSGFDRTEARLAGMQTDLHDRLTELSEQVQTAVTELRSLSTQRPQPMASPAAAWPLDGVVRLHNQLRDAPDLPRPDTAHDAPSASDALAEPLLQLPAAPTDLVERLESLERAVTDGKAELQQAASRTNRGTRAWIAAAAVFLLGIGVTVYMAMRLQRDVAAATERVADAQKQAQAATEAANRQMVAAREEAAHQIGEARETALKAQAISDVLAAPDLVRYNLVGRDQTTQFNAQALWSRSRGLVFSSSRLPAPPPDSTYQIWLLTAAEPVSVGTFVPDVNGRYTMATTTPPKVPPPLAGVTVTVERAGGSPKPTGVPVLARATE